MICENSWNIPQTSKQTETQYQTGFELVSITDPFTRYQNKTFHCLANEKEGN